jgi:hypothetical protein
VARHHAAVPQWSARRGNHRMLALTAAIVVIENDPVFRCPGSVCTRRV